MTDVRETIEVRDAARLLGISAPLAYRMAHEGKLPCLKFGDRLLVSKVALRRMLERPSQEPEGAVGK